MQRRSFLALAGTGAAASLGGCVGGTRVLLDIQRRFRIEPGESRAKKLPVVDGSAAISYTARAEKRFDLLYFTDSSSYQQYRAYLRDDDPATMPMGDQEFTKSAIPRGNTDGYEVEVPTEGKRKSLNADGSHHVVLDYSEYGHGVPVADPDEPLDVFLDLTLVDKQLPI